MKFTRIRMKIFLAMILAIALPLSITSGIIFYQVARSIEDDKSVARGRVEQDLKGRIEEFIQELNETAYQIYSNPDLIETIALKKEFLTDSRTYDTVKDIEQFFFGVYNQSRVTDIIGMYLVRNDGQLLGNFFPNVHPRFNQSYYLHLLEEVKSNAYKPEMLITYKSQYQEPAIQFLYPVRYRGIPSGLLVIDLKEQSFRGLIERYNVFYHGEIALVDPSGTAVYHTDPAQAGLVLREPSKDKHAFVIETDMKAAGWKLHYQYEIDPKQTLYRNLAILIIVIAGLLAVSLSLGLSFNLTKPIVHLHRKMVRIRSATMMRARMCGPETRSATWVTSSTGWRRRSSSWLSMT